MYPYIDLYGHRLSLIYPYTLNDEIIMDFRYSESYSFGNNTLNLYFELSNRYNVSFNIDIADLERLNRHIAEFLETYYYNPAVHSSIMHEIWCIRRHSNGNYLQYLCREISDQCTRLREISFSYYSANTELDKIRRYLRMQDRPIGRNVYDTSHQELYVSSSNVNDYRPIFLRDFEEEIRTEKKYVHPYNYIPKYEKHYVLDEDTTTLLLGAEIEVDKGGQDNEEVAKECLRIMNGDIDSEKNIYCVHDGSLPDGFELPTMPGTLAYHKTLPYKELFKYLDSKGYKSHDTTTCGLHIHINRDYFKGQSEAEYAGKLIYITEKFNDEFSILARRDCKYARFIGYSNEKCKEIYDKSKNNNNLFFMHSKKYKAVNLQHKDTIELRSFKGTLKYSTFINTLEFVSCLATFVRDHSEEEVENMEWSDLYDTFPDELKKYYDERKEYELEKIKKEEEKKVHEVFATARRDRNEVNRNGRVYDSTFYLHDQNSFLYNFQVDAISMMVATEEIVSRNAYNDPDTCTDIKAAQKALKKLKKEVKYEQNHLQKKILNQKITKLNKRIKKLKREERNNVVAV